MIKKNSAITPLAAKKKFDKLSDAKKVQTTLGFDSEFFSALVNIINRELTKRYNPVQITIPVDTITDMLADNLYGYGVFWVTYQYTKDVFWKISDHIVQKYSENGWDVQIDKVEVGAVSFLAMVFKPKQLA